MASDVQARENSLIVNDGYEQEFPVADLIEHPRNPRNGNVESIAQSIDANGFYGAVYVQRSSGYVVAGNHRMKAAVREGMSHVPVIWLDVDDATAIRILLADNRTNDQAGYLESVLAELLAEQRASDNLIGTGYDDNDVDKLLAQLEDTPLPEGDAEETTMNQMWGVIVECDTEEQQGRLLESLDSEGFRVRALVAG